MKTTILVVDDYELVRRAIAHALSLLVDTQILEASSNADVRRALARTPVDAIVMDFNRVDGNALTLMREISGYCSYRNVGVMILSGKLPQKPEDVLELEKLGVAHVCEKPMTREAMLETVSSLLRRAPVDGRLILLRSGQETANLDYKETIDITNRRAVAALSKDVIAMANTAGGGDIFFGVRQTSAGFEYCGLSHKMLKAFDATTMNDALAKYIAPLSVKSGVVHDGSRAYGYVQVANDPAHLALAKTENADAGLFLGRIYHRTQAARSEEVRDTHTLNLLLDACVRERVARAAAQS